MVDTAAPLQSVPELRQELAGRQSERRVSVELTTEAGLAAYADVARCGTFSPSQSPTWIAGWVNKLRPDFIVATLTHESQPAFSVALEIIGKGPLRVALLMSGRHANGNMPPVSATFAKCATVSDIRAVIAAIGKARPDIDVIAFERLATEIGGVRNPLLLLPHMQSPNLSLAVDLTGGFEALLGRASGKRKRKKHRSQMRKFEAAGGFRRIEARTEAETNALLDAFFAMKEVRFRRAGIVNVFADPEVQAFFRFIFAEALKEPKPTFVLHGLEVGGRIRAVTGSSRCAERLVCEFGGIADDDMAFASPGEFLFFDNIEEACRDGLSVYDFSVGDEPYKRLWCDLEIRQFDALVPLSVKGHVFAAAMRVTTRLKAFVKNNRLAEEDGRAGGTSGGLKPDRGLLARMRAVVPRVFAQKNNCPSAGSENHRKNEKNEHRRKGHHRNHLSTCLALPLNVMQWQPKAKPVSKRRTGKSWLM
jgi:CelD/BcsL family acetyltransferase involved in cellulose biosynthesis